MPYTGLDDQVDNAGYEQDIPSLRSWLRPTVPPAAIDRSGASFGGFSPDVPPSWQRGPLSSPDPSAFRPDVSSGGAAGTGATAQPPTPVARGPRSGAGQALAPARRMLPPGADVPVAPYQSPISPAGSPPSAVPQPPASSPAMPPSASSPGLSDRIEQVSQRIADRQAPKSNWAQQLGLAILSATRLAPYAQQIIHPKWTSQEGADERQLAALEKGAQGQEAVGRAHWAEAQAAEGKGRYLRVGTGVFDQQSGNWVTMPADKSNLVSIDPTVAKERGLAPLSDGTFMVPATVAAQFVKPGKEPGGMYVDAATGAKLGIVPDESGKYYLPPQGIGPHVTGSEKGETPPTATQLDARAQQLLAKMGQALPTGIPPEAMADIRKLAPLIQNSGALTPAEKSELQSHLTMKSSAASSGTQATIRLQGFLQGKEYPMLDTGNQNSPVMLNPADINAANKKEPGRYVPTGPGVPALRQTSLLEDIRGNVQQTRDSLNAMPDFDVMDKAKIALALRSRDPRSAVSSLITSGAMGTLSPAQQDYLINVTNLIENAMAMRSVLGAGQGSDELRTAITAVIPGPTTPSREYAQKQLNTFEKTLNRLEKGVPKVPLRSDTGGAGAPTTYKQTATGPNNHKIGSNDGQTWYDVQTGQKVQ